VRRSLRAAAGLGRAEAIGLARSGATVVVNDMRAALDASDVIDEIAAFFGLAPRTAKHALAGPKFLSRSADAIAPQTEVRKP
jgi:NAD(P)-dependent dehydrogenase (short-subunit alcohol dehydrogenase family)